MNRVLNRQATVFRVAFILSVMPGSVDGLSAQAAPAGAVSGLAIDSVNGSPLRFAHIVVEGVGRSAISDRVGVFRIDSVPVGSWRLVVFHPMLDSLRLSLVSSPVPVVAGETASLLISTPSVATVLRMKCAGIDGAAVIGAVSRADDTSPPSGAKVRLYWLETTISRAMGVRTITREMTAPVSDDGSFLLCGIPPDVSGRMSAIAGSDTTEAIAVSVESVPLALVSLVLRGRDVEVSTAGETMPGLRRGSASLSGVVTDAGGRGLAGVTVSIRGAAGEAVTDSAGRFTLVRQPSGSGLVIARKLGLEMVEAPVTLSASSANAVELVMSRAVVELPAVTIREQWDAALAKIGFTDRQRRRPGSFFLGSAEMDRLGGIISLPYVLVRAPNLRLQDGYIVGRVRGYTMGGVPKRSCVQFLLDGQAVRDEPGNSPQDYLPPADIGAIEIYSGDELPGDLPGAVTLKGMFDLGRCEIVVIWTRAYLGIR